MRAFWNVGRSCLASRTAHTPAPTPPNRPTAKTFVRPSSHGALKAARTLAGSRRLPHAHGRTGCRHVHPTSQHEAPGLMLCLENRPLPSDSFSTARGITSSVTQLLHQMEGMIAPSSAAGHTVLGARTSESAALRKHPQLRTALQHRSLSTRPRSPAVGWASSFSARATCCGLGGPRAWGRCYLRCKSGFLAQGGDEKVTPSSTLQRSGVRLLCVISKSALG